MTTRTTFIALLIASAGALAAPAEAALLVQAQGLFGTVTSTTAGSPPDGWFQVSSNAPDALADASRSVAPNISDGPVGTGGVTTVPEPGVWLLLVAGFGGLGLLMRRQQPIVQMAIRFG